MIINKNNLIYGLSKINNINSSLVKIIFEKNKITFKTYNNFSKIEFFIHDKEIQEEASLVINPRILLNLLNKLDKTEKLEINYNQNSLEIISGKFKTNLNTINSSEFVQFSINNDPNNWQNTNLNIQQIIELDKYVVGYSLNDTNTTNKISALNCIQITSNNENNEIYSYATDTARIISLDLKLQAKQKFEILIHNKIFNQVVKNFSSSENIEFLYNNNSVLFKTNNTLIEISLVKVNFPNVLKFLSNDTQENVVVLSRQNLIDSLERGSVISQFNGINVVNLMFQNKNLILSFKNTNQGFATEEITCETKKGNIPSCSINIIYLLNALKNLDAENVYFSMKDNISPLYVYESENKQIIQVILPINEH